MREHLSEPQVRKDIGIMCRGLFVDEYANVVLFLAHLVKDQSLIDEMLQVSKELFVECQPSRLEEDVKFLGSVGASPPPEIEYEESDTSQSRRQALVAADAIERENDSTPKHQSEGHYLDVDRSCAESLGVMARLNMAVKTIQILGQVLKSFPGYIPAEKKVELIEGCYLLGMRLLSGVLRFVEENEKRLYEGFKELLGEHYPKRSKGDIEDKARQSTVGLACLNSFGIIKYLAYSVGSEHIDAAYSKVLERLDCASIQLVDVSIALDFKPDFPEERLRKLAKKFDGNNPLAFWVLKAMVVQHFCFHPINYRIKQSLCEHLRVKYPKIRSEHNRLSSG